MFLDNSWSWPDIVGDENYPKIKIVKSEKSEKKMLLLGADDQKYNSFRATGIEVFTLE